MRKNLLAVRLGITLLTCLLLVTFTLSSCGEKAYIAVYPEEYTPYYFYQNYVQCDPNLIHLSATKNSAGKFKHNPTAMSTTPSRTFPWRSTYATATISRCLILISLHILPVIRALK